MLAESCELQEAVKFYDLGCEAGPDSISQMKRAASSIEARPASKTRLKIRFLQIGFWCNLEIGRKLDIQSS